MRVREAVIEGNKDRSGIAHGLVAILALIPLGVAWGLKYYFHHHV